jgi:hypothetical protein
MVGRPDVMVGRPKLVAARVVFALRHRTTVAARRSRRN